MGARVINSTAENYISVLTESFQKGVRKMTKLENNAKIAALVLAAGNSSRFGNNKLLFKINGKSVLERTLLALSGLKFWKNCHRHFQF